MITENIFDSVLIEPVRNGANRLHIVSGYATAAMAFHHLNIIEAMGARIEISLVVGMCPLDGLSVSNHRGFQQLVEEEYADRFQCSYVINSPPVHSKVYAWCRDESPILAFTGSANYTQFAFRSARREALSACIAEDAYNYYQSLISDTIYCTHQEAESFVRIYREEQRSRRERYSAEIAVSAGEEQPDLAGLPRISISLLDNHGNLPQRSGLNWGQRPDQNREPNQAYIRLPSTVYGTGFFPERGIHFTLLTDDARVLICSRAQDDGKAIHTPHNNSLIGEYFRNRLGLPSGVLVTKDNLLNYGRTDVTFYKIDDETFYMDFSV